MWSGCVFRDEAWSCERGVSLDRSVSLLDGRRPVLAGGGISSSFVLVGLVEFLPVGDEVLREWAGYFVVRGVSLRHGACPC